ncbi:hypothetical protein KY289_026153 [Solanum tuberosum]|nr:hypothetical protein KY289_026153 [Solanum tuberosum]
MTALLTFALRRQISTLNSFIGNENLQEARKLFDQSPHLTNVVSWNTLIAGCFKHSHIQQAEYLFDQMPHRDVICWNTNALRVAQCQQPGENACAGYPAVLVGNQVFVCILKSGVPLDSIPARNSIIGGYARHGLAERAMQEFERMLKSGIRSGGIARSMWLALMSRARRDCSKGNLHIGARPSCIILDAFQNLWIQRSVQ